MKKEFTEALQFHIQGCLADGDTLPEWAVNGDYEIEYNLSVQALLQHFDGVLTREALSKTSSPTTFRVRKFKPAC